MRRKNLVFLGYYFVYWLAIACLIPYLGIFYQQRGLSGTQIGLIQACTSLISIPAALWVGPLADRSGKPRLVLAVLTVVIFAALGSMYAMHRFALIALAAAAYGFAASPSGDVADAMLIRRLADQPQLYGNFRLGGSVGYIVGVSISGVLMRVAGLPSLFVAACVFLLATLLVVLRMPGGGPVAPLQQRGRPPRGQLGQAVRNPAFLPAYLTLVVWGLTESGVQQFLALHIVANGYETVWTSILIGAAMIGEFCFFAATPVIVRRLGSVGALAVGFAVQVARLSTLAGIAVLPVWVVLLGQMVGGGGFAMVWSASTQFIGESFPSELSYTAQTLKMVASKGVGMTVGGMLYGAAYDYLSSGMAYGGMACLAALAVAGLLLYRAALNRARAKAEAEQRTAHTR